MEDSFTAAFMEIEPILSGRSATEKGAVGVQDALGVARGSRGVNQIGRIQGGRGMGRTKAFD